MKNYSLLIVLLFLAAIFSKNAGSAEWPVLKKYDQEHSCKIALPVGGIGTGTISLGGRGNFQDVEIMNRPAKGYNPGSGRENSTFFTLFTDVDGKKDLRLLEAPVPYYLYEGSSGAIATNHGLPRFKESYFEAAYPFGQVILSTPQLPLKVRIKSFNPLIPADIDNSSIPVAVIDFELTNTSMKEISFSVCGTMQNFIGEDGSSGKAIKNRNSYKKEDNFSGIFFSTDDDTDNGTDQWGEMALVCVSKGDITYRTAWLPERWGSSILDFWDDLSKDGVMEGVQHNTMEVEYYGPNPQMTIWYLGALRVMEEMSIHMKDKKMALKCRKLFESRTKWTDENLFNGEYYIQKLVVPNKEDIPAEQLVGMGASDFGNPDYQLGEGCLVDQLVGQYLAHVCGLGYLVKKENVAKTLQKSFRRSGMRSSLWQGYGQLVGTNCVDGFPLFGSR